MSAAQPNSPACSVVGVGLGVVDDQRVLVGADSARDSTGGDDDDTETAVKDVFSSEWKPLVMLLLQHATASWSNRQIEFALFIGLAAIYPGTLVPAAVFGLVTTVAGILLSNYAGWLVDRHDNLHICRASLMVQKMSSISMSACIVVISRDGINKHVKAGLFALVIVSGCSNTLAATTNTVSVERDWVVSIARTRPDDFDARLTKLNTAMRRIDLSAKLVAPLFASLITSLVSLSVAFIIFASIDSAFLLFELFWTTKVYHSFDGLKAAQEARHARVVAAALPNPADDHTHKWKPLRAAHRAIRAYLSDWRTFCHNPIFFSSLSISLLYFTTLNFDGIFITWLVSHDWSDAFIAGMRGLTVVTGLAGTMLMPVLERRFGLTRAGLWSVCFEPICLVPAVVALFVTPAPPHVHGHAWNAVLLFGGIQLSRIFLWSFDLCQMKQVQLALRGDPRENAITSLQYALQNMGNVFKYALVLVLSKPNQFKWSALASVCSICLSAVTYLMQLQQATEGTFVSSGQDWLAKQVVKDALSLDLEVYTEVNLEL